jgi:RNA polymerase sigma-70 factor (ECF subfamily)
MEQEAADRARLVQAALQKLPEHFRTPLALRFIEELDYEQIAAIIGRTPSAARSRVHYGLQKLAALLPPEVR